MSKKPDRPSTKTSSVAGKVLRNPNSTKRAKSTAAFTLQDTRPKPKPKPKGR